MGQNSIPCALDFCTATLQHLMNYLSSDTAYLLKTLEISDHTAHLLKTLEISALSVLLTYSVPAYK
jgi:hypothetical protein